MNQRPGKFSKGLDSGMNDMNTVKSLRMASEVLKSEEMYNEAFYFEQLVDYIQEGNKLPLDKREMEKALGI